MTDHRSRLTGCLIFATIMHAILVLGVTFTSPEPPALEPLNSLDVTLVQRRSDKAPDEASYLAQANQIGGGNSDDKARPTMPTSGPLPQQQQGVAQSQRRLARDQQAQTDIVASRSSTAPPRDDNRKQNEREVDKEAYDATSQPVQSAELQAEIDDRLRAYAKRPRSKYLSANTREHKYASYMDGWVKHVERVGNLNYPEEAARRDISGDLILTVSIRYDGSIEKIQIDRTSGFDLLDRAALRIVRQAAPFDGFPLAIRNEVDVVHITRTWQFSPDDVLRDVAE